MVNFLAETLKDMGNHQQSPETVTWVGDREGGFLGTWDDFSKLADFNYDNGFGGEVINTELLVVFTDGSWLERHEYDGSEWWEYKTTPVKDIGAGPLVSQRQLKSRWLRDWDY